MVGEGQEEVGRCGSSHAKWGVGSPSKSPGATGERSAVWDGPPRRQFNLGIPHFRMVCEQRHPVESMLGIVMFSWTSGTQLSKGLSGAAAQGPGRGVWLAAPSQGE